MPWGVNPSCMCTHYTTYANYANNANYVQYVPELTVLLMGSGVLLMGSDSQSRRLLCTLSFSGFLSLLSILQHRNRLSTSLATIICSRPSQVGQFRLFILMKRGTVLWFLARFSYWDDFRTSRSACSALLQSENTKIQNSIWQSLPPQFLPVLQKGHRNSIPATSQTFFFSAN